MCDTTFYIPMVGLTQSFNVSVAAAMSLFHVCAHAVPVNNEVQFLLYYVDVVVIVVDVMYLLD